MASKPVAFLAALLVALAVSSVTRNSVAADPPTAAQALSLMPMQQNVEYSIPSKEDAAQCTVKLEKENKSTNWVVANPQGEVLRRFYDTNGDNYVDMWCYFLNGIEVYRDIDSNYNNKADQYRWFNTGGTRWATDKNEDGKIDSWKVISPHEVAEQVVLAIKNREPERFNLLLISPSELAEAGFGQSRAEEISATVKSAPQEFAKVVGDQKAVSPQTRYIDFSSARPATIPSATAGSTKDVTVCDNATALIQTGDKHEQVYLGTLVRVGDTWQIIDAPGIGADHQPAGTGLAGAAPAAGNGGAGENQPSDQMQKLMAELERLDKASDNLSADQMAANVEARVNALQSLADASAERDRDQWYRQMADVIGMAIQSGNFPAGGERLEQLQKKLTDAKADDDLIAHAAFQRMWSLYNVAQRDPDSNKQQIQSQWLTDLQEFANQFPKAADTAEALFQLGMYQEFSGKSAEAAKSYQQLVTSFPKASQYQKASGALRRLNLLGKPATLRGNDLQGTGAVDLARYRGKVVLIHYWMSSGEAWKQDMVLLQDFYAKKGGKDFEIIGVCLDDDPTAAKQYVAANKLPWKQIYERGGLESRLANEMGVITLPLMILVDQKGNVANQNTHVAELDTELARLAKPAADTANALRATPTSR